MLRSLGTTLLGTTLIAYATTQIAVAADMQEESEFKFAFYSSAWGENTDDGLRLVAHNQTDNPIRLDSITFIKDSDPSNTVSLPAQLDVPAQGYADAEFGYVDLLSNNECIARTMEGSWKLVEVSNYTLNPSVRNLIIENTDSFRIYQCVESVTTKWTDLTLGVESEKEEWVLFHFESRSEQ